MAYNWIPVLGHFVQEDGTIVFKGGTTPMEDGRLLYNVGYYVCDQTFGGGVVSGDVQFVSSVENEACEFITLLSPTYSGLYNRWPRRRGIMFRSYVGEQPMDHPCDCRRQDPVDPGPPIPLASVGTRLPRNSND